MQTWEYLVLTATKGNRGRDWIIKTPEKEVPYDSLPQLLNQLGNEGWELIGVTGKIRSEKEAIVTWVYTFTSSETYYLKRPKQ